MRRLALPVLVALSLPGAVRAQTPDDFIDRAVGAYQRLELDNAASLIRRTLGLPAAEVSTRTRVRALSYLAATELFRGRKADAAAAFKELLFLEPRFQLDQLVFPPTVRDLLDEVRRDTRIIVIVAPDSLQVPLGRGTFTIQTHANTPHDIIATVFRGDGVPVRLLYRGPVGDSMALAWDGRDSTASLVADGAYSLVVASLDPDGRTRREARLPLQLKVVRFDTLPLPARPADSLFRPVRTPRRPALRLVAGGMLLGIGAAVMPSVLGAADQASGARFALGAALTVGGVAGYLSRRPGRPIPANAAYNDSLRAAWRRQSDSVTARNRALLTDVRLSIAAGAVTRIEHDP